MSDRAALADDPAGCTITDAIAGFGEQIEPNEA